MLLPKDILPQEMAVESLMYCCLGNMSKPLLNNCIFVFSDRSSTGITVADIDFSLIDSIRAKMPISAVNIC